MDYKRQTNFSVGKLILYGFIIAIIVSVARSALCGDFNDMSYHSSNEYIKESICEQIADYKTTITISDPSIIDSNALGDAYKEVILEHPEFFWLNGRATIHGIGLSGTSTVYQINADTSCNIQNILKMDAILKSVVNTVASMANTYGTDYEKALFIHDYLIKSCEYDSDTFYSTSEYSADYNPLSFTSYGCIVDHKAVCEGYAKSYMLLMKQVGVECGYISGTANNELTSGGHAWNYIKLDDGYYMVDVAWDDPIGYNGSECLHNYFCLSTEMISKDHTANSSQYVPVCDGNKYLHKQA